MTSRVPNFLQQAYDEYDKTPSYLKKAYAEYDEEQKAKDQPAFARHSMQATIGGAKGAIYTSPGGPAAFLGDLALPGAIDEVQRDLLESDREYQEIYKNAPDKAPPINEEYLKKGAKEAEKSILGNEGFTGGILTAPFRIAGIDTNPKTENEKLTRDTSELLAMLLKGQTNFRNKAGNGMPPLPPLSIKDQAKEIGSLGLKAFTAAKLGSLGESIFGIPGLIIGQGLPFIAEVGGRKIFQKINEIPKTAREFASQSLSPEHRDKIEPFLNIAQKYDIPISPGTFAENPWIRGVEETIAKNKLTTKQAQEFRQQAAERWGSLYNEFLKDSSKAAEYESAGAVAEDLRNSVVKPHEEGLTNRAKEAYTESSKLFQGAQNVSEKGVKEIQDSVNRVLDSVSHTLFPTSTEKNVKGIAEGIPPLIQEKSLTPTQAGKPQLENFEFPIGNTENLLLQQSQEQIGRAPGKKQLMQAEARQSRGAKVTAEERRKAELKLKQLFGSEAENMYINDQGKIRFKEKYVKDLNPRNLVDSVRSLNNVIQWEDPNVLNLFADTRQTIKNVLNREYGATHASALRNYEKANALWSEKSRLFNQDKGKFKKWGIRADSTPEQLANDLNSVAKFKQFEADFGKSAQGKNLIEYIKRKKLDTELKGVFNAMQDSYIPGAVNAKVRNLEDNAFVKYLAGDKWNQFQEIASLDKFIQKNATSIYTSGIPKEAVEPFLDHLRLAMVFTEPKAAARYLIGSKAFGKVQGSYLKEMATLYESPELMKEAIGIARNSPKWKQNPDYWTARMEQFGRNLKAEAEAKEGIESSVREGMPPAK